MDKPEVLINVYNIQEAIRLPLFRNDILISVPPVFHAESYEYSPANLTQ